MKLYHQEMGKIHARTYGKRLREIGVSKGWFAILDGVLFFSQRNNKRASGANLTRTAAGEKRFVLSLSIEE